MWVRVSVLAGIVGIAVCVHLDGLNAEQKFWVWVTILGNIVCHDNGRRLATSLLFFLSEDPATMQMQERGVSKSTTDSSQRLKNKHSSLCKLSESTAICFQFSAAEARVGLSLQSRSDRNSSSSHQQCCNFILFLACYAFILIGQ